MTSMPPMRPVEGTVTGRARIRRRGFSPENSAWVKPSPMTRLMSGVFSCEAGATLPVPAMGRPRASWSEMDALARAGRHDIEVNAPGTTSSVLLQALAEAGATQCEPGNGLHGTTALHVMEDLPELPAVLYLTEVSHLHGGKAYCFGGGFYIDPIFPDYEVKALVGSEPVTASAALRSVDTDASYDCRGRNRVPGAKLSEHGKGNALDVRALRLGDGSLLRLTDPQVARELRNRLRDAACARFSTVLGPGSDGYHESHVHLDLAERRSGHRMCQWDVREPGEPAAAEPVPLPRARPTAARR